MAIAAEALGGSAAGESSMSALGRGAVEGQRESVANHPGLDLEAYGQHVHDAMAGGRPVMAPGAFVASQRPRVVREDDDDQGDDQGDNEDQADRPSRVGDSARRALAAGRAFGATVYQQGSAIGAGQGQSVVGSAAGKLTGAAAVGLVVLTIGALLTGQDYAITLPGPLKGRSGPPSYIKP